MSIQLRIYLCLIGLGAYSQIVQAVLIRESLVVFYGNEASLGAFYGSWLFWLAAGSALAFAYRDRPWVREPLPSLRLLLLLLPLALALQVFALRSVRIVLDVSASELVPLGELFASVFAVTAGSGLALGLAFPLACQALAREDERSRQSATGSQPALVSRLYAADAIGALAGGVLFTFVLVPYLGIVQTLGWVALALGLSAWSLWAGGRRRAWPAMLLAAMGLAVAVSPLTPGWERAAERLRFAVLQPGLKLLDSVETRYGHVAVASLGKGTGEQFSVVGDGQIRESFPEPTEVRDQAAYFQAQADGPKRVLVLGGMAGGLPAELLRWPVERVDVVEDDAQGFARVRPYLPAQTLKALDDPRLKLRFEDGRRFVNRLPPGERYDLALVLYAAPTSAFGNRYFTQQFYRGIRDHLTDQGVFCTQVSGASHYLGHAVGSYNGSVYRTLKSVFPHIAIAPGERQVFCASPAPVTTEDPTELERRYRAQALADHDLPDRAFQNMLPGDEVSYTRGRLEDSRSDIDTDLRPITYYLNMILWGKLSASEMVDWMERLKALGPWPYLLPPLLLVGLWLLQAGLAGFERRVMERRGAVFAMAMLGLIAMAAQLAVLFAYQARVGFMFERIALLNGLFMTGLALGAGIGAGRNSGPGDQPGQSAGSRAGLALPLALTLVIILAGGAMLALPGILAALGREQSSLVEPGFLALSAGLGLLTGIGFPLAVAIAHRDLPQAVASGGATVAADNLGGALGGLVTGALMVPLLGVEGTCRVLAWLAPLALLPLLFGWLAPDWLTAPKARGYRSFPWATLGWTLIFAVLSIYGWHLIGARTAVGPQVRFEEGRLKDVAGTLRFEERETPFVHYLGLAPEPAATEVQAVALASAAAAPEVRGFAGPVNLLMAVDRNGLLTGVRYLSSDETPSYIAGIDAWLAGLAGTSLRGAPLSGGRVDTMTGATVTSRAVLKTIDLAAARATQAAFGETFPPTAETSRGRLDLRFWATLAMLIAFVPVYVSGSDRARLTLMAASVAVLGFWLNTPITEVDLVNLSLGHAATPSQNPQRWLLLGFVGVSVLLLGPVWCGYLCPFGTLQGLVSRLGRGLGLRTYPDRRVEQPARWIKYLLLAFMLIAVWVSGDPIWATFDPMQHVFGGRLSGWMLGLAATVLVGSLFYVRFWCRYFCPMGAFLALGNKIALANRLDPRRRFEHCDLGVRDQYDLDCVRCGRCFAGTDTRVRHRPGRTGGARGRLPNQGG